MKKFFAMFMTAVMLVACLAGCGGSGSCSGSCNCFARGRGPADEAPQMRGQMRAYRMSSFLCAMSGIGDLEIYGKHDIMMFTFVRIRRNIIQDDIEGGSI